MSHASSSDAFLSHCSDDKPAVEQTLRDSPACVVFFGPGGSGPWQHREMQNPRADRPDAVLRQDLEAAGIPCQDDDGRFFDFHSLRHTFASNLARAGVPPKVAQELMRHSDVKLTINTCSQVGLDDLWSHQRQAIRPLNGGRKRSPA